MTLFKNILLTACFTFLLTSCASNQTLSQQDIFKQYPAVATLKKALDQGRADGLATFSPKAFKLATVAYSEAIGKAKNNDSSSTALANEGLNQIKQAQAVASQSRDILEEVVTARQRAQEVGAADVKRSEFKAAEADLLDVTKLIEAGEVSEAKGRRADLIRKYADLELVTVKDSTTQLARSEIQRAKQHDVDDLSPKTLRLAEEELALASSTLDADLNNKDKAQRHAEKALWHAQRATQIAEIITHFKQSDYSAEDVVLWYQKQVAKIVEPMATEVVFNENNKLVVNSLNIQIHNLKQNQGQLKVALKESQQTTLTTIEQSEEDKRRSVVITSKFAFVSKLFDSKEAETYRQGNNLLIRAHGFSFPSGKSEIASNNFSLLNKIIEAANQFPGSQVVISGHTDANGNETANLSLSQARAHKVAKFLIEIGKLDVNRISWVGYGESKPVASNKAASGRASNRRVEILIINKKV